MIARYWHGVTPLSKAEAYARYIEQTGATEQRGTPGCIGTFILRRLQTDGAHFVVLSLWDSPEAIRNFAGDDIVRARYYPEDKEYLIELEPEVTHFDVVSFPAALISDGVTS